MQVEQSALKQRSQVMLRHVAVPNEHGSWVFLFCPLLIGLFAGGKFHSGSLLLVGASLAAFMLRQPITILVKILSKRRPRTELPRSPYMDRNLRDNRPGLSDWVVGHGILPATISGGSGFASVCLAFVAGEPAV